MSDNPTTKPCRICEREIPTGRICANWPGRLCETCLHNLTPIVGYLGMGGAFAIIRKMLVAPELPDNREEAMAWLENWREKGLH